MGGDPNIERAIDGISPANFAEGTLALEHAFRDPYTYDWACNVFKQNRIKTRLFKLRNTGIELHRGTKTGAVLLKTFAFSPSIVVTKVTESRVDVVLNSDYSVRIDPCDAGLVSSVLRGHIGKLSPSYMAKCLVNEFGIYIRFHAEATKAAKNAGAKIDETEIAALRTKIEWQHNLVLKYMNLVAKAVESRFATKINEFGGGKMDSEAQLLQRERDLLKDLVTEIGTHKAQMRHLRPEKEKEHGAKDHGGKDEA